ncbi:MAG TPA: helix-hairpin-helix domain-containing protein [Candidatus Baltobacteraceae bacterium]|nr:helix-hairpin-helix domain-containing protein [Candidatus Baltobacteraceae bacterium]
MKYVWIAAAALAALVIIVRHPSQPSPALAVATAAPHFRPLRTIAAPAAAESVVYVAGAVARPGLYRLPPGARANDGIRLAGGFTPKADQAGINLAQHVEDGDEVRVPVLGERPARAAPARSRRSARTRKAAARTVELNTASPEQLGTLPGLGPALAERIVAFRDANGAFASVDELLDVAGMTQRRLDAIAPYLLVNGAR